MSDVRADIVAWIAAALHELRLVRSLDPIAEESGLLGKGIGLDSLEVLQLVVAAEERFDLTVDESELKPEHFRTVGSFASFLGERLSGS
jgi:acyl carrier protein